MQSVQLIALVTFNFEPALPVLTRLMGDTLEFMTVDAAALSDPTEHDNWQKVEFCTADDLDQMKKIVSALGGNPARVLADFPNCDHY